MKAAVIILSDPATGSEEALARLFNGLAVAYEFKHRGDEVTILFQGTGTRWAGHLVREDHPAHPMYKAVEDKIAGVSCGCAEFWGVREEAEQNGFELISDNAVPGTSGLPSLRKLIADNFHIMTF